MVTADQIEQWDTYRGLDECPHDFDAFWQDRMKEADAVELSYELCAADVPSFETCEFFDLWFEGMCAARCHAKVVRPRAAEPTPVVMQFHGYPGSSRSWLESASFAGMGMTLIAFDCPGQGGPSYDAGGFAGPTVSGHLIAGLEGAPADHYYVRTHQDIRILMRIVEQLPGIDGNRLLVNGASQGGGLGIATCALNPDVVRGAAILYPFLSDFRLVWELGADQIAYEDLRYFTRWRDPQGAELDRAFSRLAYVDSKNFAHLVRCPVLFGTGLADEVCPPQTQCAVYNNLTAPKQRLLFEGFGHEEIQAFDDRIIEFFQEVCDGDR